MSSDKHQENDFTLRERGYFWWADEPISDGQLTPQSPVPGLLTINRDGVAYLDLDEVISKGQNSFTAVMDAHEKNTSICGLLIKDNQYVILIDSIQCSYRVGFGSINYQKFKSFKCIIGKGYLSARDLSIHSIEVPLNGFEQWLGLRSIEVKVDEKTIKAEYKIPETITYNFDNFDLSIKYNAIAPWHSDGQINNVEIKEISHISYDTKGSMTIEEAIYKTTSISELIMILTDSDYTLEYPTIKLYNKKEYIMYFYKKKTNSSPQEYFKFPILFTHIKDRFGDIFLSWEESRNKFGPGLYLYTSTRRGNQFYVEHYFASLIWGLESFHRTKYKTPPSEKLMEKINRILSYMKEGTTSDNITKSDLKWLERKLKHAQEPTLSERLKKLIIDLPIELDNKKIDKFTESCANIRNNLSHFGGNKNKDIKKIQNIINALSYIYHMIILLEIGITNEELTLWIHGSFSSHEIKKSLSDAGINHYNPEEEIEKLINDRMNKIK